MLRSDQCSALALFGQPTAGRLVVSLAPRFSLLKLRFSKEMFLQLVVFTPPDWMIVDPRF